MADKILVIDDDTSFCMMLKTFLQKNGFEVQNAFTAKEGIEQISNHTFEIILTDIRLPDADGLEILNKVTSDAIAAKVILMTGYTDIKTAVKAMKMGAFDYVGKPINPDEILFTIHQALKTQKSGDNDINPKKKTKKNSIIPFVRGVSEAAITLHQHIDLVAPTNMSVLIIGDSGTGKEYIAHSIHTQSKRSSKPFIAVDCGAIPKELASSELFGHIKGSFTGAITDKTGHFEAANSGTLFLDEVGNLSYDVQIQLLRALQERKIKPVGSNHEIDVDIRIIAATNEDLSEAVKKGDFREDLYHRLNEFGIHAPKLCERKGDIMTFANHFLAEANLDLEKDIKDFETDVIGIFLHYDWPGNLREMKNTIKRAVLLEQSKKITIKVLPLEMLNQKEPQELILDKSNERERILEALKNTGNNKSKAAKILKIDRKTLYNKLKLYNLDF